LPVSSLRPNLQAAAVPAAQQPSVPVDALMSNKKMGMCGAAIDDVRVYDLYTLVVAL
jgi:hypothetical protein